MLQGSTGIDVLYLGLVMHRLSTAPGRGAIHREGQGCTQFPTALVGHPFIEVSRTAYNRPIVMKPPHP